MEITLRGGGSMTIVDMTKEQCAELANYLRSILNKGVGAGCFDKVEMALAQGLYPDSSPGMLQRLYRPND